MRNGFIVVVWLLLISFGVLGWLGQTKYAWWSKTQVADTNQPATQLSSDRKTAEIGTAEKNTADIDADKSTPKETETAEAKTSQETTAAGSETSGTSDESVDSAQANQSVKTPSFDIVRVEPDGTAVIAGRAEPGASVSVLVDGQPVVDGQADARGEWAFLVEKPISPGNHNVTLSSEVSGQIVLSDQSVAIGLPEREDEKPLIVLSKKGEPSKILQAPANTPEPKAEPGVETQVAAKQPADPTSTNSRSAAATVTDPASAPGASSGKLALKTVDYDDDGNMIFTGTAIPKGSVRIYVNNKLIADAMANLSGVWTLRVVKQVEPGNHYLRVDQLTKNSKVASRIELPFTRVDPKRVIAALNSGRRPKVQQPDTGKAAGRDAGGQSTSAQGKVAENVGTATNSGSATSASKDTAESAGKKGTGERLAEKGSDRTADKLTALTTETETTSSAVRDSSIVEQALSTSSSTATSDSVGTAPAQQEPEQQVAESDAASAMEEDGGNQQVAVVISPAGPGISSGAKQPQSVSGVSARQSNIVQRVGRVIIQPGNNLWNISREIYGSGVSYTAIYRANKGQIRDPHLIYPGQIFTTPGVLPPEQIQP